jgi:hypothetical protein
MSNFTRLVLGTALSLFVAGLHAHAEDITIGGQLTEYPVLVQAQNSGCDGHSPTAFGYSLDDQSKLTLGKTAYEIDQTDATILPGRHTIRFKSWTKAGICPVVDVNVTVVAPQQSNPGGSHVIPSNAVATSGMDGSSHWEWNHDPGTPGTSVGSSSYPASSPSMDNAAREFKVSYADRGGEIYHLSFANDKAATHFVYDTYVYVSDPSQLANLEMDMNHVMADGRTVILATQCSSYSGTWQYTGAEKSGTHWYSSNVPCNPENWAANSWHHVQIATHHDSNGKATYDWVNIDGTYGDFKDASLPSVLSLGWAAGDLLINFQLDGASRDRGDIVAYTDKLTVYRW